MKYVYIGANYDLTPLKAIGKHGDVFIYVDSKPRSRKGNRYKFNWYGENEYGCPEFLSFLFQTMELNNFEYQYNPHECVIDPFHVPQCLSFYNPVRDISIHYYINVAFPQQFQRIRDVIIGTNAVIVCSYQPNVDILLKDPDRNSIPLTYVEVYSKKGISREDTLTEKNHTHFNKFVYIDKRKIPSKIVSTFYNWNDYIKERNMLNL
jgi:hypothetical protein